MLGAFAFMLLKELFQSEALLGAFARHWQLTLGLTIIAFVALLPKGSSACRRSCAALARAGAACRMTILLHGDAA